MGTSGLSPFARFTPRTIFLHETFAALSLCAFFCPGGFYLMSLAAIGADSRSQFRQRPFPVVLARGFRRFHRQQSLRSKSGSGPSPSRLDVGRGGRRAQSERRHLDRWTHRRVSRFRVFSHNPADRAFGVRAAGRGPKPEWRHVHQRTDRHLSRLGFVPGHRPHGSVALRARGRSSQPDGRGGGHASLRRLSGNRLFREPDQFQQFSVRNPRRLQRVGVGGALKDPKSQT